MVFNIKKNRKENRHDQHHVVFQKINTDPSNSFLYYSQLLSSDLYCVLHTVSDQPLRTLFKGHRSTFPSLKQTMGKKAHKLEPQTGQILNLDQLTHMCKQHVLQTVLKKSFSSSSVYLSVCLSVYLSVWNMRGKGCFHRHPQGQLKHVKHIDVINKTLMHQYETV